MTETSTSTPASPSKKEGVKIQTPDVGNQIAKNNEQRQPNEVNSQKLQGNEEEQSDEGMQRVFGSFSALLNQEMANLNSTIKATVGEIPRMDEAVLLKKELELKQKEIELLKREMELTTPSLSPWRGETPPKQTTIEASKFICSFQDIEGSMTKFTGKEGYLLEKWIQDIEDAAKTYSWLDIQMTTYAKRLLDGDAKKALRTTAHIATWENLKTFLMKEFKPNHTSATIHKQMAARRKKIEESYMSYLIAMMELGRAIEMEEEAIIEYCIEGIEDYEPNKAVLYGATTIDEFKKKLCCYEEIKRKTRTRTVLPSVQNTSVAKPTGNRRIGDKKIKCYICGEMGHLANVCPHKGKGNKCFKCQNFGHIAIKCPERKEGIDTMQSSKSTSSQNQSVLFAVKRQMPNETREQKKIVIEGLELYAMVDSGSDLNFISQKKTKEIGGLEVNQEITKFRGVGSGELKTVGSVKVMMEVDDDAFLTTLHVVEDGLLPADVVLGQELLKRTITILTPNQITIRKFVPELMALTEVIEKLPVDLYHMENKQLREEVVGLVEKYQPRKEAVSGVIKMEIILANNKPVYSRPRRLAPLELEIVRGQVEEWLKEGIIRVSMSEYASPVVLANKKDGSKRLCVDYRKLNAVVIRDRYPLPLVDDQLDRLQGARYFSTLDLCNGFFHVPIAADSNKYTSFVTPFGQYEFLRASFGLCNSPATFQRFVNNIFRKLCNEKVACIYMDDIIIPATTEEEAVNRLKRVLGVAEYNGLKINWRKSKLMVQKVEYLGYEIESGTIRPSRDKQMAILKFPEPNNVRQCQRFLGLTGYFRRFVEGYAVIAKPISDLLKKDMPFKYGPLEKQAVEKLKKVLTSSPVLQMYSMEARTELQTDASKHGMGAILVQENGEDKQLHPVFYFSRKTTKCEMNYCSYELEVLAIVSALKKFRVYLLGLKFKIVTDCAAFKGTMERKELSSRIAGWALTLQEFDYELEHRAAHRMRHVDALSRAPVIMAIQSEVMNRVKAAQKDDEHIQTILKVIETAAYKNYTNSHGILYKVVNGTECLVVPRAMQTEVIKSYHKQGHFGVKKTEDKLKKEFFMENMTKKITSVIKNCVNCIMVDRKEGKQDGLLNPIPKGDKPFATYHVDHLGHLSPTRKRYQYIFCVVDAFTKFVWLYPTKGTTTKETIQKLEVQKAIFGNPKYIISDRATAFTSNEFQEYCQDEHIKHHVITTGVPSGNGQVERVNRIIIPVLAKLAREAPDEWYKHVDRVQMYINNSYQRAINRSPFELLFGTVMNSAEDLKIKETIETEIASSFDHVRDEMREDARRTIETIQREYKKGFDRRRKVATKYKVGDWVVIKRTQFGSGQKIAPKFMGPYEITAVNNNDRYCIRKTDGSAEGPNLTSSSAENMKMYFNGMSDDENSEWDDENQQPASSNERSARENSKEQETTDESDFLGFPDEDLVDLIGHPGRMPCRMAE